MYNVNTRIICMCSSLKFKKGDYVEQDYGFLDICLNKKIFLSLVIFCYFFLNFVCETACPQKHDKRIMLISWEYF